VGINLAIQDSVAAANLLAGKLLRRSVSTVDLEKVQRRREWPAALIQYMQAFVHRHVVTGRQKSDKASLPLVPRLLKTFPILRQIPARLVGIGPRPEHIKAVEAAVSAAML
jgi:2-polyprenyl-6-methoxyphenol hydroxylase-like FAD-dependent oxidoreductase